MDQIFIFLEKSLGSNIDTSSSELPVVEVALKRILKYGKMVDRRIYLNLVPHPQIQTV